MTAAGVDQRADAEPGARPEDHLRRAAAEVERADPARPTFGNRGQRQRLRLEVVEQQALREAELGRRSGAVHHPGRVGELEPAIDDRAGAAGDDRTRPGAEPRDRRLDRFRQSGVVPGSEVDYRSERRLGRNFERKTHIRAAGVADQRGKRKGELAHGRH